MQEKIFRADFADINIGRVTLITARLTAFARWGHRRIIVCVLDGTGIIANLSKQIKLGIAGTSLIFSGTARADSCCTVARLTRVLTLNADASH